MSDLSSPPTVDTATYPPSTRLEVTIDCIIDQDGKLEPLKHFNTRTGLSYLYGPIDGEMDVDAAVEMYGARVSRIEYAKAPAPYSEPREGDRVLITRDPVEGIVKINSDGEAFCFGEDGTAYIDRHQFARARTEGRVRLVEAAAPTFEPGRIYRDVDDDLWFRTADDTQPWLFLSRDGHAMHATTSTPVDPVPCDFVPAPAPTPEGNTP